MGRKKEASLEDVRFEVSRLVSSLNVIDARLQKLAPKTRLPDIPPAWVLKAARANMNRTNHWTDFYSVLDDFYGFPHLNAKVDSSVDPKYVAVYRYEDRTVYSREKEMSDKTALHEYYHHLNHLLGFPSNSHGEEGQQLADAYAEACLAVEEAP